MAILLIRYSEIGLKSIPVRKRFEDRLMDNIMDMLVADGIEAFVSKAEARFFVETKMPDRAIASLKKVFGIGSMSVAETSEPDMESICIKAGEYSKGKLQKGQTFAVKARREGDQKFTSMDVGREAGSAIWDANLDQDPAVDLSNPDVIFYIEVRPRKAYIFMSYIRCHAGLPIGTQGVVTADLGGDREILSAWLMMKRGCRVTVCGNGDVSLLKMYDPGLRTAPSISEAPQALGHVCGCSIDNVADYDILQFRTPVYFPTVGMTDEEVESYLFKIRSECITNKS